MAVLSDQDRITVSSQAMQDISARRDPINITKIELKAAVDALDAFMNANATAVNNALPAAAKANLTTQQKALLLMYVIARRYEVS